MRLWVVVRSSSAASVVAVAGIGTDSVVGAGAVGPRNLTHPARAAAAHPSRASDL